MFRNALINGGDDACIIRTGTFTKFINMYEMHGCHLVCSRYQSKYIHTPRKAEGIASSLNLYWIVDPMEPRKCARLFAFMTTSQSRGFSTKRVN